MSGIFSTEDRRAVDTARLLAADAVEKVGHGHPGTAMSLAPVAYLLYQKVMRHDPTDPTWAGRDRFILSAGHSSLTQYVQLFLGGFGLEIEDIKALRTWDSLTPGHPEYGHTKGVEITTGPLGQGLASATGFAYAQRFERGLFDPEAPVGQSPFDHYTYVIASDGDLQEGVTGEAASLAGHQKLGSLIALYDANQISIEDDTTIAFTEDVAARYRAYGWQVLEVDFGSAANYNEDVDSIFAAIGEGQKDTERPTLIIVKTIIGWPAPNKKNTGKIHGSAVGAEEIAKTKEILGFPTDEHFHVEPEILAHTRSLSNRASQARSTWQASFDAWATREPERKALWDRMESGQLPDLASVLPEFEVGKSIATRQASGVAINQIAGVMPELWGGSCDLAESNLTTIHDASSFAPEEHSTSVWTAHPYGRVMHFGIREHAMGSILNGIALHGKTRAFGGTFLIFSDYMRPPVRLAALMGIPTIYVWTHDSVALGEDGPTHQPIEQLWSLRAIPGLSMIRPSDATETAWAWKAMLERTDGPQGIALTRQGIPVLDRGDGEATADTLAHASHVARGGYTLIDSTTASPDLIIIATGSEVSLALEARDTLESEGVGTRVVAMPCVEWFDEQDQAYRDGVLPPQVTARVSVEAGIGMGWRRFVGDAGESVSIEQFGYSADVKTLFEKLGITAEAVVKAGKRVTGKK
jgi:transketolase